MLYKIIYFSFIVIIFHLNLSGQDPAYIIYDTKDGLPSSEVYDVEIDESGLLIFSTDRGVCSFDGYDFKTYTTSDGLADNTNFNIFKDSKKQLWFAGYSGNMTIYKDGKFSPYQYNDSLTTMLKGYWLDYMTESKDKSLNLTSHFAITESIIKLSQNEYPRVVSISDLVEYKDHIKYRDSKIIPFNHHALVFGPFATKKPNVKVNISLKNENIWIYNDENLFRKINSNGQIIQSFETKKNILGKYIDQNENLLLFNSEGLFFFPDCDVNKPPIHYFKNIEITDVLHDYEGNYWITTLKKGIIFVPSFEIKTITLPPGTSDRFLSIGYLKDNILFGNENKQILHCDIKNVCQTVEINYNYSKQIKHITRNNDLLQFSGNEAFEKNGQITIQRSKDVKNFGLLLANDEMIHFIERGYLITDSDLQEVMQSQTIEEDPFNEKITKIVQTENKNIWLGCLKGLFLVENQNYNNIQSHFLESKNTFGRVNDIEEDINDNIWVATIGNGLCYVNHSSGKNYRFTKENGLISNLINTIKIQNDSTLWVGSNKGVNIVNYKHYVDSISIYNVRSLTTRDGIISNFINDINYWNSTIYLATDRGICYFSPTVIEKENGPVPIQINELIVNDSIYAATDSLEFDYDHNDIFIHFTGLNFRKTKENDFYKYRLIRNDEDADWFYTNEKNIRYSDLTPANYLFEVNAQNNSSQWNENAAHLAFTIHPHFTQTNWFKILLGLLLFGLFAIFYFIQMRRLRLRDEAKIKLEKAQLRIREAELSALRNQMNPHFVYNALNSIQNFIFKKDFEKANYYLVKFSRLMRNSLNFSRLDLITIKEELNFLNDYIELEKMRFPNKFICNFIVENNLPIQSLMIPSLLLQPVLENVIKHAFKDIKYTGKMDVHFSQNKMNQLEIVIEDNGPGIKNSNSNEIDQDAAHTSLGLEIIKNRINLINETNLTTESSMTLVNKDKIDNKISGLKVIFILPVTYNI